MITAATAENLKRKSAIVDKVQFHQGLPLFSFIDLNITELCNRKCTFCPRHDPEKYPNQDLHISIPLIEKMAAELASLQWQGIVNICGYGEPLMCPHVVPVVQILSDRGIQVEIVTNGDRVTAPLAKALHAAGLRKLVISLYDGPQQRERFQNMLREEGDDFYVLRDRWYDATADYGLVLTNRAGVLSNGPDANAYREHACYYTHYMMTIDWNGDVLLCVQDWNKRVKMGNAFSQSLVEIWSSHLWSRFRRRLLQGERSKLDPCCHCNANGTLHGASHAAAWQQMVKPPPPQAATV